ncbi:CBS domain protein [Litorimonas taeanensis]|uniref:CBS domain protein n=1 Tax=Litorimonas taeanensis TaxID=568099 RepID=A0A420WEU3_9PROT|nr:hemolysin family protein [Litorimonas taeanensis]RKQ69496.1 CBS domain protein [Litorimonas taeanensis]
MSDPTSEPRLLKRLFRRGTSNTQADSDNSGDELTKATAAQELMMNAAERFHLLRVDDVMVPRANIVAVDNSATLTELSLAFKDAGHSRLPVYKDTLDDPIGMVHIKDLLPYLMLDAKGRTGKTYPNRKVIQYIRRPVLFVPPSMLAQDLLRRMQARRTHMAIVVDEYGGTDGLVTIEDLIEPIVGDIDDEHDEVEVEVQNVPGKGGRSVWEADARLSIEAFENTLGRDFATPDQEEDVDTLGGLIFTMAGRVPERGEIIKHADGLEFEIIDADPRRLKRLRITDTRSAKKTETTAVSSEQNVTPLPEK